MSAARPSPESTSSHNLRAMTLRAFLYGLQTNMTRTIWQPFALHLGVPMSLLGLLESIGGFFGLVSTAMLPLGGWLSDRRGRKPVIAVASLFGFAALATFSLAAWRGEWRLLLPGVVLLGLIAIARPAVDSITAESTAPEARGHAFSLVNTSYAAAGVLTPTIGGFLASRYGFLSALAVGAGLELATFGLVAMFVTETLPRGARQPLRTSEFFSLVRRLATPPAKLRSFYVAAAIDAIAFGMGATILFGLLSDTYGFTPFQLGLMSSVQSLTWAISQLFIGRQVDKRGCVLFLIISELISVVVLAGWMVVKSYPAFLVLHAVGGLAVAAWVPAFMAWITNSVPEKQRAEEIGRLGAFRGFLSFPAPYVGGLLYEAFGFSGPIAANLVGAVIVTVLLWLFVKDPPPLPPGETNSPVERT